MTTVNDPDMVCVNPPDESLKHSGFGIPHPASQRAKFHLSINITLQVPFIITHGTSLP